MPSMGFSILNLFKEHGFKSCPIVNALYSFAVLPMTVSALKGFASHVFSQYWEEGIVIDDTTYN